MTSVVSFRCKYLCLFYMDVIAYHYLNILRPRQDGRHFPDDNFKCNFLNENVCISIDISMKFVPNGSIGNIPVLVQMMAWRRLEQAIIWTNVGMFTDAYMRLSTSMS